MGWLIVLIVLLFIFLLFGVDYFVNRFLLLTTNYLHIPSITLQYRGCYINIFQTHNVTKLKRLLQLLRRQVIKIHSTDWFDYKRVVPDFFIFLLVCLGCYYLFAFWLFLARSIPALLSTRNYQEYKNNNKKSLVWSINILKVSCQHQPQSWVSCNTPRWPFWKQPNQPRFSIAWARSMWRSQLTLETSSTHFQQPVSRQQSQLTLETFSMHFK